MPFGTGCAIFWVPFFEQKVNFGVSFLVKSQGASYYTEITPLDIDFDQIPHTSLKFWIAVTVVGYTFSKARKFYWDIVFTKIHEFLGCDFRRQMANPRHPPIEVTPPPLRI